MTSARPRRTVLARNCQSPHPYGLMRVAARLHTTTPSRIGRLELSERALISVADVHTTRMPNPTIQPPCRLAQGRNRSGTYRRCLEVPETSSRHKTATSRKLQI